MAEKTLKRTLIRVQNVVRGAIATGLLLGATLAFADHSENTLLVWAGDQAHIAPDFVAVIDFDRTSSNYGKVLRTVPLSGSSAVGNERTMSASPAMGGRWPSVASSAFCVVRIRSSSSTSPIPAIRHLSDPTIRPNHPSPTSLPR
jgi:hypothetical protein